MTAAAAENLSNLLHFLSGSWFARQVHFANIGQVIERRNLHPKNLDTYSQPPVELQHDSAVHAMLNKEIAEKTRELRQTRGEDLQGLSMEELQKLEKIIEGSLCRVMEMKGDKIRKEIKCSRVQGAAINGGEPAIEAENNEFIKGPRAISRTRPVIRFYGDQYQQQLS
ncbi:hypothetical protein OIU74_015721 [Salix koriyanagi]|uniref:K-box domain-containing protein n=1 Tax=Salix koriyanagi TaxID=2511006 RepID=A0A9Q0PNB7_9ROSI|nr:hypothetical protein OIU74_015721 [Salix koriyanagi]